MSKGKRAVDAEDLDLVPIMNLVTILIPFLLMASSFVGLAVIDSTLPAIGPQPENTGEQDKKLNLSILITDQGFTIAGAEAVLGADGEDAGPTVPCTRLGCPSPATYDAAELTRILSQIKDRFPEEEHVIVVPEPGVPYEVVIVTMDASSSDPSTKVDGKARELFPYVVIAGGTQ
jgi:hypothetical protein